MSQTILIEPNEKLKKIYSLNLNTYAATDVVDRKNADEAIELLKILPSISLIICNAEVGQEKTAIKLHNFLEEEGLNIPMIILGECKELMGSVLTLKAPIAWEVLIKHAADTLGVEREDRKPKARPAFFPVESYFFYDIDHTPCDVYIRIKKGDGAYQFVKRLHAQDSFTQEDIAKYEKQGLTHFHIPKDYQQYFVNFVTNSIIQELERDDLDLASRLTTNSNAYEIVKDQIARAGLNDTINQLAETCIQSMVKTVQEAPRLADLLKKLFSNKIGYAYQHAHLVCVIGDFVLSKQPWYQKKHLDLFTLVSFFADITLVTPKQIRINSMAELNESDLSDEQKQATLNHAIDAADIIKDYPASIPAIQEIILQHQGAMDGYGFNSEPSEDLHAISKVFLVADAFVKILLDPEMPKNKKDILTILYAGFTGPSYQKIVKVLEQKID